jgi:hypothetical protein
MARSRTFCAIGTILGEINHHGRSWPGEHPSIIDPETFEKVQGRLREQRVARTARLRSITLFRGKLH